MPTVLAFIPLKSAYTISGSTSGMFCTPRDKPYMPMAPGKLHMRKAKMAGSRPARIRAMQKSILVLAGPGSAWQMAKSS